MSDESAGRTEHDAPGNGEDESNDGSGHPWTPGALSDLRARPDRRRVALVAAAFLGLLSVSVHWIGLFIAGALVGLVSETLPRALIAGLALGALVLVLHVLASPLMGPGEFLALAPASYITVGAALLAPAWGSLVRGVV